MKSIMADGFTRLEQIDGDGGEYSENVKSQITFRSTSVGG